VETRSKRPARHKQEEAKHQRALISWAQRVRLDNPPDPDGRFLDDYLIAIPNGGKRSKREAALLKAEGVKAGVSDLLLPIPNGTYSGLWVELKVGDNYPSKDQRSWGYRMVACGYAFRCCWDWLAAKHAIQEYLDDKLEGEPYAYRRLQDS
jgi:hypothetical protein